MDIRNVFSKDESASVVPLGFILVITVISVALVIFNSTTAPSLNEKAEVEAHSDIETDFLNLDTAVYRVGTTGVQQPVIIGENPDYIPSLGPRTNPSPLTRSEGPYDFYVDNGQYVSNSTANNFTRDTNYIRFDPDYSYFASARGYGYEHGLFYTQPNDVEHGDSGIIIRDAQTIIRDEQVTLVSIEGNVSVSRPSPVQLLFTEVENEKVETTIEGDGGPITIHLPTRIPESQWETALNPQNTSNGGHITDIRYSTTNPNTGNDDGTNYVSIDLESGVEYNLNLYTVNVRQG